jgi:hypothetical protein
MAKRKQKLVIRCKATGMEKGRLKGRTKPGAGERWKRARKR